MDKSFNAVTFRLQTNTYALDALKVRGIVGGQVWKPLSLDGEGQSFIQVRGQTTPVLDLRRKFGMPEISKGGLNSFIAVQSPGVERDRLVALWVDEILEIINVPEEELKTVPDSFQGMPAHYLQAMIRGPEGAVYVVNVEEVLSTGFSDGRGLAMENKAS